jgi:GGDEF domain-containing protein
MMAAVVVSLGAVPLLIMWTPFGASISRDDIVDLDTRTVVDHLVDAADVAMYEAKRAGGNQTRRAESIEIHSR